MLGDLISMSGPCWAITCLRRPQADLQRDQRLLQARQDIEPGEQDVAGDKPEQAS